GDRPERDRTRWQAAAIRNDVRTLAACRPPNGPARFLGKGRAQPLQPPVSQQRTRAAEDDPGAGNWHLSCPMSRAGAPSTSNGPPSRQLHNREPFPRHRACPGVRAIATAMRDHSANEPPFETRARRSRGDGHVRVVQFPQNESLLSVAAPDLLATGSTAAEPLVVLSTARHGSSLERAMAARRVGVPLALGRGHGIWLDAAETL